MAYGLKNLIGTPIGDIGTPLNVTDVYASRAYCFPSLTGNGTAVTSGTSIYGYGNWVQLIDASLTTHDFTILGYTFTSSDSFSTFYGAKLQFGTGGIGNVTAFSSSVIPYISNASSSRIRQTVPISFSHRIPAGSRVSVRIADSSTTAYTYYIKIIYTTNIRQGGIYLNNYVDPSNNFNSATLTSSATACTYGSYVQLIQTGAITSDYFIRGMYIQQYSATNPPVEGQIALSMSPAGYEPFAIAIEVPFSSYASDSSNTFVTYFPFSTALKIPANLRLSAAFANYWGVARSIGVGVDVTKGTFYG